MPLIHVTLDWPTSSDPHTEIHEVEDRIEQHPTLKERLEWLGHGAGFQTADVGYTTSNADGLLPLLREALASTRAQDIHLHIYEDDGDTLEDTILNDAERPLNRVASNPTPGEHVVYTAVTS